MKKSEMIDKDIMVSVFVLTYNHADYIRDTFDGILSQKTDYRYEIVVLDDASTDGTSDIVREYADRYPEIFVPIILDHNTYNSLERSDIDRDVYCNYMHGKYIAMCEGDDYWTDPDKLQLQVDYMEQHPECSLTMHNGVKIDYSTDETTRILEPSCDHIVTPNELITQEYGQWPTASIVVRREFYDLRRLYDECGTITHVGDKPLQLNALCNGTIYYFERDMSCYRCNHIGSWTRNIYNNTVNMILFQLRLFRFYRNYNKYTNEKYEPCIITAEMSRMAYIIYVLQNDKVACRILNIDCDDQDCNNNDKNHSKQGIAPEELSKDDKELSKDNNDDCLTDGTIGDLSNIAEKSMNNGKEDSSDSRDADLYNYKKESIEQLLAMKAECEELRRIIKVRSDDTYITEETRQFCNNCDKIYIMGTGDFAKLLTSQLVANDIAIDGYVVSNNQELTEDKRIFLGKPVLKLCELNEADRRQGTYNCSNTNRQHESIYKEVDANGDVMRNVHMNTEKANDDDTDNLKKLYGVLVAIIKAPWYELYDSLMENKIENYYCPYISRF